MRVKGSGLSDLLFNTAICSGVCEGFIWETEGGYGQCRRRYQQTALKWHWDDSGLMEAHYILMASWVVNRSWSQPWPEGVRARWARWTLKTTSILPQQHDLPPSRAAPTFTFSCQITASQPAPRNHPRMKQLETEKSRRARRLWSAGRHQVDQMCSSRWKQQQNLRGRLMRWGQALTSCKNIILLQKLEITCIFLLECIEDLINAIAYYSILRNATAHMHRICFWHKSYIYIYEIYENSLYIYLLRMLCTLTYQVGFWCSGC